MFVSFHLPPPSSEAKNVRGARRLEIFSKDICWAVRVIVQLSSHPQEEVVGVFELLPLALANEIVRLQVFE